MKYIENDMASFYCDSEPVISSVSRFCLLIRKHPSILQPFRGIDKGIEAIFASEGFQLYPTYKKTTVFNDPSSNCFFKIIHLMTFKTRIQFLLMNKSRNIYDLSEYLYSKGMKIQRITAYGLFKKGRQAFYATKKAEGETLFNILIRDKKLMKMTDYQNIIGEIAKLHNTGHWLGDARLDHIFIKDGKVSGLVDIDSIRKNRPYMIKNFAKDIAGLNQPGLSLTNDEKLSLLVYYLDRTGTKNKNKFLQLIKKYTERRWKGQ